MTPDVPSITHAPVVERTADFAAQPTETLHLWNSEY